MAVKRFMREGWERSREGVEASVPRHSGLIPYMQQEAIPTVHLKFAT
jgi:hypothetical protein